ncbi:hypothetical protein [Peterkaempfera bronchialis]|uniref:hypothetical protein n=1 Tax=Peterkaempfera bronchialis TaxID=2126346 RepID=UPI003C2DC0FF
MLGAGTQNDLGLTEPLETEPRCFHTRPCLVMDGYFTGALTATINDPRLRGLPPVGAIDQFVDSTDVTRFSDRRRRYITGPGLGTPQLEQ